MRWTWLWLGLAACGGDGQETDHPGVDDDPSGDTGSAAAAPIGPEGGSLTVDGVTVSIPPGALDEPVELVLEVDVTPPTALPGLQPTTSVVRVTPHGLELAAPATLTLPSDDPGGPAETWTLADEDDTTWQLLGPATFEDGSLSFETTHFSYFVGGKRRGPVVENPCGAALGYAPGSPWPADNGCETGRRSTWAVAPTAAPTVRWTWDSAPDYAALGPVVDAGGALYVTTTYQVVKLSPDGQELWRAPIAPEVPGQPVNQTPPLLLANGLVLVCRSFAATGMVAFDAADGSLAWQSPTAGCGWGVANVDQGHGGAIVTSDGLIRTGLMVVDPDDGTVLWTYDGPRTCVGFPAADAADNVYCTDLAQLWSLSPDGRERWASNLDAFNPIAGGAALVVVDGEERVAARLMNATLDVALYPTSGPSGQTNDPDVPRMVGAWLGRLAYGEDAVVALRAGTGASGGLVATSYTEAGKPASTAAWTSDTGYGRTLIPLPEPLLDGAGVTLAGTREGAVVAVGADGVTRWSVQVAPVDHPIASLGIGPDGTVYAVETDGYNFWARLHAVR